MALVVLIMLFCGWSFVGIAAWIILRMPGKSEKKKEVLQSALDIKDDGGFYLMLPVVVRHLSHSMSWFKWVPYYDEPPLEDREEYSGFFHYHFAVNKNNEYVEGRSVRVFCLFMDTMLGLLLVMFFLGGGLAPGLFFIFELPWTIVSALLFYAAWKYPLCLMEEKMLFDMVHARLRRIMGSE